MGGCGMVISFNDLYDEAKTPFSWHEELFFYSKEIGIDIFSSPFDESAVDLLESLDTPAYKVASFELIDIPLIKYIAKTGKPILMSTGMASEDEISEALEPPDLMEQEIFYYFIALVAILHQLSKQI